MSRTSTSVCHPSKPIYICNNLLSFRAQESCSPQLKVLKIWFSMVELTCKRGVCHFVTVTCNKYLTKCRVSGYRLEIMNSNWVCEDRETGCDASLWFSYGFLSKWFWAAQGTIWEEDVRYHELYLGLWWTEGGLNMSLWFFYDFF